MKKLNLLILLVCLTVCPWVLASEQLDIRIDGIQDQPLKNAQLRLDALRQFYGKSLTPNNIDELYRRAPSQIKKALEPFGYFKATVTAKESHTNHAWALTFHVTPGPRLTIKSVSITAIGAGKDNPVLQKTIKKNHLKIGKPLLTEQYNTEKNALLETATNQGYLSAHLVKSQIQINLPNNTATITLEIDTGPRYYFGPVTFGDSPFSTDFLKRFVTFADNQTFSSETLLKLQQDLANSGYFQQAIVTPDIKHAVQRHVPIKVTVTAKKSQRYSFGIGYGTFTGPRATASVDLRRITSTGQHFNAQVQYSSVLKSLGATYYIPGKHPATDKYVLGANIQQFSPENGYSVSKSFSAGYTRKISIWQHKFTFNYLSELYKLDDNPSRFSGIFYPSYSLTRLNADNLIYPHHGSRFELILQGSSKNIFSTTSFLQSELKGKYIFSPSKKSRVILRGDLGYTVVNDLKKLPLTLHFLAGGLDSVRGYPYSGLGPGRYLEVASAEYQHRIFGHWNGAVFYDAGNATNHFNLALNTSEGVGIIYQSMLGPIRLYLAHANSAPPGKKLDVEFSIGPDF